MICPPRCAPVLNLVVQRPGLRVQEIRDRLGLKYDDTAGLVHELRRLGLLAPTVASDHPDYGRVFFTATRPMPFLAFVAKWGSRGYDVFMDGAPPDATSKPEARAFHAARIKRQIEEMCADRSPIEAWTDVASQARLFVIWPLGISMPCVRSGILILTEQHQCIGFLPELGSTPGHPKVWSDDSTGGAS